MPCLGRCFDEPYVVYVWKFAGNRNHKRTQTSILNLADSSSRCVRCRTHFAPDTNGHANAGPVTRKRVTLYLKDCALSVDVGHTDAI